MTQSAHILAPHGGHLPSEVLERAAGMLRAAGSVERLRLLECLRAGEACVTALAEHLGESVTATSNRLQILAREALVVRRRQDQHHFYRLADAHVEALIDLAFAHAGHVHVTAD